MKDNSIVPENRFKHEFRSPKVVYVLECNITERLAILQSLALKEILEERIKRCKDFIEQMEEFDHQQAEKTNASALRISGLGTVHTKTLLNELEQMLRDAQ